MVEDLTIRPAWTTEQDDVARVVAEAFGDGHPQHGTEVAELWAQVAADGHVLASLVAVRDGIRVGHVGLSHAWLDARCALVDVWLLSPLSVTPPVQRRGIGSALVAAALAEARAAGAPMVCLEGSPDYYGTRGFSRGRSCGVTAATARVPDAAFQVALLESHEDWMTGRLVLHDVWWRHDAVGLRDPRLAALEERFGGSGERDSLVP